MNYELSTHFLSCRSNRSLLARTLELEHGDLVAIRGGALERVMEIAKTMCRARHRVELEPRARRRSVSGAALQRVAALGRVVSHNPRHGRRGRHRRRRKRDPVDPSAPPLDNHRRQPRHRLIAHRRRRVRRLRHAVCCQLGRTRVYKLRYGVADAPGASGASVLRQRQRHVYGVPRRYCRWCAHRDSAVCTSLSCGMYRRMAAKEERVSPMFDSLPMKRTSPKHLARVAGTGMWSQFCGVATVQNVRSCN
jgi:hypothetical protein